jgi:hypothetical protein
MTLEQGAEAEKLAQQQKTEGEAPQPKSLSGWRRLLRLFH